MENTIDPTTTNYSDQLDIITLSLDILINRVEMLILLVVFLSTLYVYSLFRRNKNNG